MKRIAWSCLLAVAGCVGADPQATGEGPSSPPSNGDARGATPTDAAGTSPAPQDADAGTPDAAFVPWFDRPDEAVATPNGGNAGTVAVCGTRRVYGFLANDSKRAFVRWLDDAGAQKGAHVFTSDAPMGLTGIVLDEAGNTYLSMSIRGALSGGPLSSAIEPHRKSETGIFAHECVVMRLDADTNAFKWARFYTVRRRRARRRRLGARPPAPTRSAPLPGKPELECSATCRVVDARRRRRTSERT